MSWRVMGSSNGLVYQRADSPNGVEALRIAREMCERDERLTTWVISPRGTYVPGWRTHAISKELLRDRRVKPHRKRVRV